MGVARKHVLGAFSFHVVHGGDFLVSDCCRVAVVLLSCCCRVAVVVSNAHNQDTKDV